jgi:LysM repeat protein
MGGCAGEIQPAESPTASLAPYVSPTPSRTSTPWAATPEAPVDLEPSPTPFVHVVKEGDTLLAIALKYGVELDQLLAANPEIDPHFLSVGDSLKIPGPNGEPVQGLLPTSTPLPLVVPAAGCYPTTSNELACLAMVNNPGETAIEALSGQISLLAGSGQVLDSRLVYAPLNLLPPGGRMLLYATFDPPDQAVAGVQTQIRNAVEAQTPSDRYLEVDAGTPQVDFSDDRRLASVKGTLNVSATDANGAWRLAMLAIGFDANDRAIGFAKWDSGEDPVQTAHQAFAFYVYSLGPPIDHIAFMAEARLADATILTPTP